MSPDELRESYLRFFEAREHVRHPSDSLIPEHDPTLLFTGAGMNQFKAMFLGKGSLPDRRVTTTQKCLRMPDLDNVGRTASHHTFFEMLGNFSFGDYFKEQAIGWAWQYLGSLGIPPERLSVTVYEDDDEAAALWIDGVGVPAARVFRGAEDENFWPASAPSQGPNGICGPCSEIYFDYEPERGPIPPTGPAADGSRFVEVWNLVFTQFERHDGGRLEPLPQKNIDTGMGFERIVRVIESLQAGHVLASNFDTSLFAPSMDAIHEHVGRAPGFGTPEGTRTRRIADHVRAACFCIADGIRPSNEKQGYVVRKVLRRAMLDRHLLSGDLRTPWLADLAGVVIATMRTAWPELHEARDVIASSIALEEEKFAGAFLGGTQRLRALAERSREEGRSTLAGRQAFLLYDTFGLPLDMQRQLLEEEGLDVDEQGYAAAMAEQRRRSREGSKISDRIFDEGPLAAVSGSLPTTVFVRESLVVQDARVLAVVDDPEAGSDEDDRRHVILVLDRTPFYAEGGGQVGDRGRIQGHGYRVDVDDVLGLRGIHLHRGVVVDGRPEPGPCVAQVDAPARAATARNHTATHLLHAALRNTLGEQVTQAGSLVAPDRLRFDFRFPRALTAQELETVEDLVNRWILANADVGGESMSRDAAREQGAIALFGEKYGDVVRVVRIADPYDGHDSVELCGGTHVRRSGDIGLIRITSEASIAAGVRRLEARTGEGVVALVREQGEILRQAASLFKTSADRLEERIRSTQDELKNTRRELDDARRLMVEERLRTALRDWNGLRVLVAPLEGVPVKKLREIAGEYVKRDCDLVLLAVPDDGGTSILATAGPRAHERGLEAHTVVAAVGKVLGGKGGGNPTFAQGRAGPAQNLEATLQGVLDDLAAAAR